MKRILNLLSKDKKVQKSLSFRVFATLGTFGVAYLFTGNAFVSLPIAGAQAVTNTIIYYYHEGYWNEQNKPKEKPKDPEMNEYYRKYGVD